MRCLEHVYASLAIMVVPAIAVPTATTSWQAGFPGIKTPSPSQPTPDPDLAIPMPHYDPPDLPRGPNLTQQPAKGSASDAKQYKNSRQLVSGQLPSPEEQEWLDEGEYLPHLTPGIVIPNYDDELSPMTPEYPDTTMSALAPMEPQANHTLVGREEIESTFKGYIDHCEGCLMRGEDKMWCVCRSTKGQPESVLKRVECEANLGKRLGNSDGNLVVGFYI